MNQQRMPDARLVRRRRSNATLLLLLALLVAIALGAYGLWYVFFRPSGPPPVAAPHVSAPSSASTADSSASPAAADGSSATGALEGTWNVDTSSGSFSDFSSSWVGYRVQEELAGVGGNVAVGRTPDVSGSLTLQGSEVTAAKIAADVSTLQSDDQRRDGQLRRQGLETDQFPQATFELTQPITLAAVPSDGAKMSAQATGNLALHGQTKQVQVPLEVSRSGAVITVTGAIPIAFADYGIPKPQSFIVLSIADQGTMELHLNFTKG